MTEQVTAQVTAQVMGLVAAQRLEEAVEVAVRAYGEAVYGYLIGLMGDPDAAADVAQVWAVRVWQGLGRFSGRSSLKTWLFRVAHNAALRALEDPHRRRALPLAPADADALPARLTRTVTDGWRQTAEKQRLWAAVEGLPAQDKALLSLRLQHGMAWRDIAITMTPSDDAAAVTAAAARLRKRFERLKDTLRQQLQPPT